MLRRIALLIVAVAVVSGTFPVTVHAETLRQRQWYLDPLRIAETQRIADGSGVTVAVLEGGVAADHENLAGQVLPGMGFGPYKGTDGRVDHDSADNHGTCMAGIIAGKGAGPNSTLGIAPGAKILPVAIPLGEGDDADDKVTEGIRWAVDHGAQVINMSFGVETISTTLTESYNEAVRYAIEHDVVLVSSTGNLDASTYRVIPLPARVPGVVAVANTDRDANAYYTSVSGPETVLAAPGQDIVCPTRVPNGYGNSTGTSSSGAIVSGVAALIRSKYPDMDAANVVNRLIKTAKDQGNPGRDSVFGFGTVRPYDALTADVASVSEYPLALPELPKAAVTTRSGVKADPATVAWGIGLGAAGVFVLLSLVWHRVRKIRRQRLQPTPTLPLTTTPLTVAPMVPTVTPQPGVIVPQTSFGPPTTVSAPPVPQQPQPPAPVDLRNVPPNLPADTPKLPPQ